MMGRTHAATGACAGLAVAPLLGLHTLPEVAPFAAASAGYALLPDLDHPHATASRFLGPLTGLLSSVLRACSAGLYQLTKGPRDENCRGTHRHMTHTVAFAAGLGYATAGAVSLGGPWVVLAVVALGLLLAADVLGDWVLLAALGAVAITAGTGGLDDALTAVGGWVGIAVALGCVTHCLGDAVTLSGCPFLWPVPIAGETWYELRPPRWLRFRTGGNVENLLIMPATIIGGLLLLPGAWDLVLHLIDRASDSTTNATP